MTHEIGIGVIGMGWMGRAYSRAYRQIAARFYDSLVPASRGRPQGAPLPTVNTDTTTCQVVAVGAGLVPDLRRMS